MSHLCVKWVSLLRDANYTAVYLASYFIISLKATENPKLEKIISPCPFLHSREALTWNAIY